MIGEGMTRFSATLPENTAATVQLFSELTGKPYSKIIRELIERGLKAERAKGAES